MLQPDGWPLVDANLEAFSFFDLENIGAPVHKLGVMSWFTWWQ